MTIETFPHDITVTVDESFSNTIAAREGRGLWCKTDEGERLRVDFVTPSEVAVEDLAALIGKRVHIGHVSTSLYYANSVTVYADQAMTENLVDGGKMTDAEYDAQRIQWARADAAASKASEPPDFDEHAAGMCDPRHSLSRFHDGVVVIPAALINQQNGTKP